LTGVRTFASVWRLSSASLDSNRSRSVIQLVSSIRSAMDSLNAARTTNTAPSIARYPKMIRTVHAVNHALLIYRHDQIGLMRLLECTVTSPRLIPEVQIQTQHIASRNRESTPCWESCCNVTGHVPNDKQATHTENVMEVVGCIILHTLELSQSGLLLRGQSMTARSPQFSLCMGRPQKG